MAKVLTIGIGSILMQELDPVTGADVGTEFSLGDTLEDSFSMTNDEGTEVTINIEESSDPVYSNPGNNTLSVTWQSPNADMENVAKVTGGTYTAGTGYTSPRNRVTKDYRVTVVTEQGYDLVLNRLRTTAVVEGSFGKNNPLMLTVNGTALAPLNSTEGAWSVDEKDATP